MIKVFGIGNVLLKDDGIGVEVAKALKQNEQEQIEIYVMEIFVEEALDHIEEGDYILILDAVDLNKKPGELAFFSFKDCSKRTNARKFCHDRSLLDTLLLFYPTMSGELIGIQIAAIEYEEGVSLELKKQFPCIVKEVSDHIEKLVREREADA